VLLWRLSVLRVFFSAEGGWLRLGNQVWFREIYLEKTWKMGLFWPLACDIFTLAEYHWIPGR
jgi:hypothetical protein